MNNTEGHHGQGRRDTQQATQVHLILTRGRDSQIPSPSNGPHEDSFHRDTVEPRNGYRTARLLTRELGHFRLAPIGHAGHPMQIGRTQPQYTKGIQTGQIDPKAVFRTQTAGHGGRASQAT